MKVYHGARTHYQTIAYMYVLVVSPGFSLVREIVNQWISEVNRWHQEHGLALWGKGRVKNMLPIKQRRWNCLKVLKNQGYYHRSLLGWVLNNLIFTEWGPRPIKSINRDDRTLNVVFHPLAKHIFSKVFFCWPSQESQECQKCKTGQNVKLSNFKISKNFNQ